MDVAKLQELGLTHNEALTFTALLELGETKTGAIVKKTGMHRVLIYDALESLIKKGLASYVIKENIKYFQAADPSRLVDFLQEKEGTAKLLLPELNLLKQEGGSKQTVSIFEGITGLKSAMNNMLKELSPGGTHYVFASGHMSEAMGSYYDIYQAIKKRNKIKTYAIADLPFKKRRELIERTVAEIRFYPLNYFPTDTWVYNDKVLIVTYTAKPPIAIVITSSETASSYKKLFEGYWKKARK